MKRGPLEVGRCHGCSIFLICIEDLLELRLGWICAENQEGSETIDETGGELESYVGAMGLIWSLLNGQPLCKGNDTQEDG